MRRLVIGLVALAILALPAHAQRHGQAGPTPEEIEKKREAADLDRQYKAALQRSQAETKTTSGRKDPWANMRAPADNSAR
jgi:hypothetical protein